MSHRQVPEDRLPALRFFGWVLVWMGGLYGIWAWVWALAT